MTTFTKLSDIASSLSAVCDDLNELGQSDIAEQVSRAAEAVAARAYVIADAAASLCPDY